MMQSLENSVPYHMTARRRCLGFTIVELLVCIAIIGIMVGLLTPSIQAMRESSRRALCHSRLVPIGMAIHNYHDRWQHYPLGTVAESGPVISGRQGNHHNWLGRLMDQLDQPVIASKIDRTVSVYANENSAVLSLSVPAVQCPSFVGFPENVSSYVGMHHPTEKGIDENDHGVFLLNKVVRREEVTDGLANTVFVSEKTPDPNDQGWLCGTHATIRNAGGPLETVATNPATVPATKVGSIGSLHPGGVHLMFGSGEIRFQSNQVDLRLLQQLVDRRDGKLPLHLMSIDEQRRQSIQ